MIRCIMCTVLLTGTIIAVFLFMKMSTGSDNCDLSIEKTDPFNCLNNKPLNPINEQHPYTDEQFYKDMLSLHEFYRSKHSSEPLTLKETLSSNALSWAKTLANTNNFKHQPNNNYGENLYKFWSTNPSIQVTAKDAFCSWYKEGINYDYSKEPSDIESVGHFTQAIWNRSKYIGVAKVKDASGQTTVIVAEYDPPGNYIGQFRANVLSPC